MATRYAVGSGVWSDTSDVWSDTDGGAAGSYVPVDGDTVVILTAVNVQVDVDQSAWTGLLGMTVRGGATPGMVYWKNGTSGTLKFRTGANIEGTTDTNRGRILANSDGSWATATELTYATKAIIMLGGNAELECTNLDVKMICDEPAITSLRAYGTKYDFAGDTAVDPATDIIDLGTTPPTAGTAVMVYSAAGTLPTGLLADTMYYVRAVSGDTCKLATLNSDAQIVDITADGSGTCTLYTGFASGSATVNVLDNVTADNWTAGDTVVLANVGPQNYDQQHNITIDTINAATAVLSTTVNSNQNPGARIFLSTRNCSILHSATSSSQRIVDNGVNCIFGEIRATQGTTTTFYCYGIYSGSGNTATSISGCSSGINSGSGNTATNISGCNSGIYSGSGNTATSILGCNSGINSGSGNTATSISGCGYGINSGSGNRVSNLSGNSYDIRETGNVYASGGIIPDEPENYNENTDGEIGMIFSEHHAGVYGAQKIIQCFGDAIKVAAGEGSPTPSQRAGGSTSLIELSNLQSNLSGTGGSGYADNKIIAWEPRSVRVWAAASTSKTYRFYIQSTFAITSADDIVLRATYHDSGADTEWATVESDETITVRDDIADWDQYVEVAVNPSRTGWVTFDIELRAYSAGGQVFIDPLMVIS